MQLTLKKLFFFSFLFFTTIVTAVAGGVDSLRAVVWKMPRDTSRVKIYIKIINRIQHTDPKAAFAYTDTAMHLADSLGWPKGIAYSHHYYALLYTGQKAFSRSLDHLLKADSIYQLINEVKNSASILNSIGNIYYYLKNHDRAMEYYEQSIERYRSINNAEGIATELNNIGSVNSEAKRYEKALYYYNQALDVRKRQMDTLGIISTISSIGLVYDKTGDPQKALACYDTAITLCRLTGDNFHLCTIYSQVGWVYEAQKSYDSTIKYMNLALSLADKVGDPDVLRDGYKSLSLVYEAIGRPDPAYAYYKKFIRLRDSVYSEENAQRFVQTEMNFQFEKQDALKKAEQEKKDAMEHQRKQVRVMVRYAFIAGLIIVLLIGVVMVRGNLRKKRDNIALSRQKLEIERQKKEIQDSIAYAKYIQDAILPGNGVLQEHWKEAFVLFSPRDVVSGDFYLSVQKADELWLAAADCTGHGVPGAFMSLVASNKFHAILNSRQDGPAGVLMKLNDRMLETLGQEKDGAVPRDGMDIALVRFDRAKMQLQYAGANRPLWLIRKGTLMEFSPHKIAIGGFTPAGTVFEQQIIPVQKDDLVYLFSDGYADQFGGEKDKKFGTKRFRELLLSLAGKNISEQKAALEDTHKQWRSRSAQTDDILIIGIRI